ncbi:MAG: DUF1573 domain-containing protein [Chloroflexi bacterium]|nr:DUF1573 domain-containing protein [Chloroflexota bacterium]
MKDQTGRMLLTIILIGLVSLIGGAAYGYARSVPSPTAQAGRIKITPASWDFGEIPPTAKVSHTFTVTNVGQGPLDITGVSTSCGCTTAEVDRTRLKPGEQTTLRVTFDPQAHGGSTGRFLRLVYVRSNDPERPEVQIEIHVTVSR